MAKKATDNITNVFWKKSFFANFYFQNHVFLIINFSNFEFLHAFFIYEKKAFYDTPNFCKNLNKPFFNKNRSGKKSIFNGSKNK